jgi:hypothetical protein
MPGNDEQSSRSEDALLARFRGRSSEYDEEDARYWREAGEQERGKTLYQLLTFAQNVMDSMSPRPEEPLIFPRFPGRHQQ